MDLELYFASIFIVKFHGVIQSLDDISITGKAR